jgi:flagellin
MFSINTNNNAMAALQSLTATNQALSETQNEVSTGKKVNSAADNPAVYAISQQMNGTIAGLSAVQDNLSFGAQVVATASSAASSISSALATLQNTLTQGQTQGMNQTLMNQNITQALTQINTFASSATMNGVNLISGAQGGGVANTQLNVLTTTGGSSISVGGIGAQALNATAGGLGIAGLSTSSTAANDAIGADTSQTINGGGVGTGIVLTAGGTAVTQQSALGAAAVNTNVTLQTSNFGTVGAGTAQNSAQSWTFVLSNGTTNSQNDILNALNNAATSAALAPNGGNTTNDYGNAGGVADNSGGAGTTFTVANGKIGLASNSANGSITDLGNGSSEYSLVTERDSGGNATRTVNVIAVNVTDVLAASTSGQTGLADLNGQSIHNSVQAEQTRASVLSTLTSTMNATGFSATLDSANNLTVVGNNVNTNTGTGGLSVNNISAAGTGYGSESVVFSASILSGATDVISGVTLTAGAGGLTAAEQATAFSNLGAGTTAPTGPVTLGSGHVYTTSGTALGSWSTGAASGSTLVFSSVASNVSLLTPTGATVTAVAKNVAGTTLSGAAGAIANITAAVAKLGTISATLGSATQEITGMTNFSSSLSDALTAGVGALTDADLASESAKLTSLQTKQQLAIQSLSIANQGPQSLLSLFK